MNSGELAILANRVARRVRTLIPRSANRQLEEGNTASTWLQGNIPRHIKLLHTLVRAASSRNAQTPTGGYGEKIGGSLGNIAKRRKKKFLGITYKKKYDEINVHDLKLIILDFINTQNIDLRYRTRDDERRYCDEFGNKLANYLNQKGYRKMVENNGSKTAEVWKGERVLDNLNSTLIEHQRLQKYAVDDQAFADTNSTLKLSMDYIVANARNSLRFRVGNCEEVASTAFAMLALGKNSASSGIVDDDATPVELVYIKSIDEGAAHFFVILNRANYDEEPIADSQETWIADPDTIVCDPWITDEGLGGRITDRSMAEIVDWLNSSAICVRAQTTIGEGGNFIDTDDQPLFYL